VELDYLFWRIQQCLSRPEPSASTGTSANQFTTHAAI
jgi:hypothetical protein